MNVKVNVVLQTSQYVAMMEALEARLAELQNLMWDNRNSFYIDDIREEYEELSHAHNLIDCYVSAHTSLPT